MDAYKKALGVALLVGTAVILLWPSKQPPLDTTKVDSIAAANESLVKQNNVLKVERAQLVVERDGIRKERDALKKKAAEETKALRLAREQLISSDSIKKLVAVLGDTTDTLPRYALEAAYSSAMEQIDWALTIIAGKDAIILKDSLDAVKSDSIILNQQHEIYNLQSLYASEKVVSRWWQDQYEGKNNPWCGAKCGVVLGVAGTVLAVYLVDKLNNLDQPQQANIVLARIGLP